MSRFRAGHLRDIAPYTPGEQPRDMRYVKLNTNESPFPPAPGVVKALEGGAVQSLNLYSDPTARDLEDAIAAAYGVKPAQVIAGNGSDEILAFAFQALCEPAQGVCFADITYGFYPVYARLYGLAAHVLPLDAGLRIRPEDYFRAGRTIFLANPNAPTGIALPRAAIEDILRQNPDHVVVVDEAYVDFGAESMAPLVDAYDNLLVVMTFSKSRSLAGARIGFAIGSEAITGDLRAIKYSFNPYNINRLSLLAGKAAIEDEPYFRRCTQAIMQTREMTRAALVSRGFTLTDSRANFLFARPPGLSGEGYYRALKARGVLVRHFAAPRISDFVRITVGSDAQMQALLAATDDTLQNPSRP